ncbi:hypothetical protein BB559_000812 [Furculomyces boomerangus]|uniref:Potassium channel domain-containing protein n=1 Tax=Furculomyces boomerangus TaxID=61424 RepID=A0A2T9Z403_9FUNG|nr:hypothetical protein BB559_000812 [Furculomyces boomerangus]
MSGQDSFSNQGIKSTEPKSLLFNSVTQQKHHKAPKKKSKIRWVISLAGFITPITLLLNGMFLTSSWFGDGGSVDVRVSFFVSFVAATIAFLFRSLEYNVVITTFLTVLLSTVCGLLVYDWIDTKNFEKKGSGMTRSQRRFHFSVLGVYIWTAIGAGIFMSLEKFDFYFAVYFCFVTITTIGFGDVVPIRASSRILTLIWLFVGIIIFGVYLINARDVIAQAVSTRKPMDLPSSFIFLLCVIYNRYGDLTPKSRLSIIFFNFIIIIAVSTFAGYVASVVELYQDLLLSLLKRNVNHQQKHLQDPNHGMHNMMIGKLLGNPFKKGSTDITLSKTPQHQPPSEHSLEMENVYTTETKTEDTIENYVKITPSINN